MTLQWHRGNRQTGFFCFRTRENIEFPRGYGALLVPLLIRFVRKPDGSLLIAPSSTPLNFSSFLELEHILCVITHILVIRCGIS